MGLVCSRVTISTDASMKGWGAVCQGCSVWVLWRPSWRGVHVNLLKLEAVCQVLVNFLPVSWGKPVLIRTDNSAVVSYINRQGGMHSWPLHNRAHRLLLWAQARGVSLRAVYLPGKDNVAADLLSRGGPLPGNIVQATWGRFGRAQVDLFASQETTHCPWWYSMIGPQGHIGGGCPSIHMAPRPSVRFPPLPLLPAVLARVRMFQARVLLVAPDWPHQPWMAELVTMLVGIPWRLPARLDMLSQARGLLWHQNPGFTGCMFGPWAGAIQRSSCSSYEDSAGSQSPLYQGALRWSLEQVLWLVPFQG